MTGRRALESFTALVLVIAACVPAISNAAEVRPIIKAGFGLGGDTVVTVGVNGSSGSSTRSIKANQGVFVGGGASILTDSKELEAEISISYKFYIIAAQNGHLDWNRVAARCARLLPHAQRSFGRRPDLPFDSNP